MRFFTLLFCCLSASTGNTQTPAALKGVSMPFEKFTLHSSPADSLVARTLAPMLNGSIDSLESFFGHPFPRKFEVYIFPDRALLDHQWQQDWGDTTFQSECWMVASGVAHRLDILSPAAWATQACEHKASDTLALRRLLCHELVHVYHGQHNPRPDFSGMDEMGWWVEGIAVYASGQLDETRLNGVRQLIQNNATPGSLRQFWSGKYKYGLSGSVASWLDATRGRATLFQLLTLTETAQAFQMLTTDEQTFLHLWKIHWLKKP